LKCSNGNRPSGLPTGGYVRRPLPETHAALISITTIRALFRSVWSPGFDPDYHPRTWLPLGSDTVSDTPSTAGRTRLEPFIRESIYFINLYIVLRFDIQSVERRFYIPGPRDHLPPHLSRRRQAVSRASAPFSRYVLPVRLIPDEQDVLLVYVLFLTYIHIPLRCRFAFVLATCGSTIRR